MLAQTHIWRADASWGELDVIYFRGLWKAGDGANVRPLGEGSRGGNVLCGEVLRVRLGINLEIIDHTLSLKSPPVNNVSITQSKQGHIYANA